MLIIFLFTIKAHNDPILDAKLISVEKAVSVAKDHCLKEWNFKDCHEIQVLFENFEQRQNKPFILLSDLYNNLFFQQNFEEAKKVAEQFEQHKLTEGSLNESSIFNMSAKETLKQNFAIFGQNYKMLGDRGNLTKFIMNKIVEILEKQSVFEVTEYSLEMSIIDRALESRIDEKMIPEGDLRSFIEMLKALQSGDKEQAVKLLIRNGNYLEAVLLYKTTGLKNKKLLRTIMESFQMMLSRKQIIQAVKIRKIMNIIMFK